MNEWKNIVDVNLLTSENANFYLSAKGLLMLKLSESDYDGRAFLSLNFPFEKQDEYISVMNEEKEEIGMITRLADFDEDAAALLRAEIKKKYFAPKISKIVKLNERFGFSYWDCETDFGAISFTVKDTYRSIIHVTEDRVFILDCDGCRYEIESLKGLDKKSFSKLELYI